MFPFHVEEAGGAAHVIEVCRKALDDRANSERLLDERNVPAQLRRLHSGEVLVVAGVQPEDV